MEIRTEYAAPTGLNYILVWSSTKMSRLTALGRVVRFAIHPHPKLARRANGTCVSWILKFLLRRQSLIEIRKSAFINPC